MPPVDLNCRGYAMCDLSASHRFVRFQSLASMTLAVGGLMISSGLRSAAADYTVPGDFPTIQAALDSVSAGDVVRVAAGTYQENLDFKQKDVDLVGTSGAVTTIIDAASGTGVKIGPAGSISGFTIRNARASFGAGMSVSGLNSYIAYNIFEDNSQTGGGYGAAIGMNSSSPVIEGNIFRRNTADTQFLSGVIGMVNGSSPLIANNIFHDNPCRAINVTVPSSAAPVIVNNTLVRNQTGIRVDRRVNTINQVYRNNIVVDNQIGFETEFGTEANNPVWENNLVSGNETDYKTISSQTGINGNISTDPLFVDSLAGNFRLKLESPAIDAGTNMSAPSQDFDREARPVDGNGDGIATVDIGADELAFGINLVIEGGDILECASPQGTQARIEGRVFPDGIQLDTAELFLNGISVSGSLPADLTLPFGKSLLEVIATTSDGREVRGRREVEVVDTLPPVINARFVDRRTGKTITSIDRHGMEFVTVKIESSDACDPDPSVRSVIGSEIEDGDRLRFLGSQNQVVLTTDELSLKVSSTDASGNMADKTVSLTFSDKKDVSDCKQPPTMRGLLTKWVKKIPGFGGKPVKRH